MATDPPPAAVPPEATAPAPAALRSKAAAPKTRWRSADLFGAGHEIEIEHGPAVYRLRLTSLGKLILTK